MKLYIEELKKLNSIKLCLMAHPDNESDSEFEDRINDCDEIIDSLTSIELPSDEDIDKQAFQVPYDGTDTFYDKSFINGAKWIKEQILNQNK